MGLTDVMTLHYEEVLTGTWYEKKPRQPKDKGVSFHYDIIDEKDSSYATLLNNIQTEETVQTIKTDDKIDIKVNSFIATQDGLLWQVAGVIKRLKSEGTEQALRLMKETIQTTRIIRLIQVENTMGLK